MKKAIYFGAIVAFVGSMSIATVGTKTFAAKSHAAMINIRLCSSAPVGVAGDAHIVQGIWKGIDIALTNMRPAFSKAGMNLQKLFTQNDANVSGSGYDVGVESSNAHRCLDNPADMASISTLNSGAAQASEPVLNKGAMAMISPANTNPVLTSPLKKDRKIYEPLYLNGKLKYPTYYRVVTTDALQGPVGAIYMHTALHLKKYYLVDDQQTYGAGLAAHFAAYGNRLGLTPLGHGHLDTTSTASISTSAASIARSIVSAKPQFVYCGCDEPYAGPMFKAARRAGYTGYFIGGDAISDPSFGTFAGGNQNLTNTYATTVGNSAAVSKSFKKLEHRFYPSWTPGPYDALAFDAANVALQSILKAKKAGALHGSPYNKRKSILKYIATGTYKGTIGKFHFDKNGDTSLRILTVLKWKGTAWSQVKVFNSKNIPKTIKPTP